jgi:hypothetical protein
MLNIVGGISKLLTTLMFDLFWTVVIVVAIVVAVAVLKIVVTKLLFRKTLTKNLSDSDMVCLFIKIPPDNEYKEDAMAAFLQTLHRVLPAFIPSRQVEYD